jgi:hypothetical protein
MEELAVACLVGRRPNWCERQMSKKWIYFCSEFSFCFRMLCRALGVGAIPSMLYEGSEKYYLFDS